MNESKVVRYRIPNVQLTPHADDRMFNPERHTLMITHADYKALEDECERLRARVGELEASCDELAVHVADLRESLSVEIGRDISLVSAEI